MAVYQDVWVDGEVVEEGARDCHTRWAIVAGVIETLGGKGRMLDWGAQAGYFAIRAAQRFPNLEVVAVDTDRRLRETVERQSTSLPNLQVVETHAHLEDVAANGPWDVVLALSVLHHLELDEAKRAVRWMQHTTKAALIENPLRDEHRFTNRKEVAYPLDDIAQREGWPVACMTRVRRPGMGPHVGAKLRPMYLLGRLPTPGPVKGVVKDGTRAASRTAQVWDEAWKAIGYRPVRGTLNLHGDDVEKVVGWGPPELVGVQWGKDPSQNWHWWEWQVWWPITLEGIACHARVDPGRLEVVAPVMLRDELRLDTDYVVTVDRPTSGR